MGWNPAVSAEVLSQLTANQLALLGLATADNQVAQNTAIPTNILAMGAPPYIPTLKPPAALDRMTTAGSPYTLFTVTEPSRLWVANMSFAAGTDPSYSGSNDPAGRVYINGISTTVVLCQVVLSAPGQALVSPSGLTIGGIQLAAGDTVYADVNGGNAIDDVSMNACAVALYSTP
jgi:hypothetical protein